MLVQKVVFFKYTGFLRGHKMKKVLHLLKRGAMSLGECCQTFRHSVMVSSSLVETFMKNGQFG